MPRSVLRGVGQHARMVACDGMRTSASRWSQHGGPIREACPDCGLAVAPTVSHILWCCSKYAHLRTLAQPCDALAA
eukprot:11112346-Alexandrium_andersonii.AAC.1